MIARKQWLEQKIKSIETQLMTFPEGKLYCTRNGNRTKWYHCKEHKSTYLPKKERKLAEQLAVKEYLLYLLDDMQDEKKAIEFYLQHCKTKVNCAERFAKEKTGFQELLASYPDFDSNLLESSSDSIDREIQQWLKAPYKKNPYFPEQLTHKTLSDYCVRSKSEAMIDTALRMNQIPFRYECELILGECTVYPDFTIKHPKTGKIYYWEHFGRMDDPNYYHKPFHKLQLYTMNQIVPGIQLITTYETAKQPLSIETVDEIIKKLVDK